MERFSNFVIKHRWLLISLTFALTLFLTYSMRKIKINSDFVSYLPQTDEAVKIAKYIGNKYGGNLTAIVAIETNDIFDPEVLKNIHDLTEKLKYIEGVSYVTSLTNVIDIKGTEEGLEIGKLIDEIPEDPEKLTEIKNYVLSKDLYRNIVSRDAKVALILCKLMEGVDRESVAREIKRIVEAEKIKGKFYYGGLPFQMIDMSKLIIDDLKVLTPIVVVVMLVVLFLSFRNLKYVILPLLSVTFSIIWTLGLMAILNIPLTIISNTIPVILTAIGTAYGIHIVNKFREDSTIINPKEKAKVTLSEIALPVFLAGVTTIAGFMSFVSGSYLIMIKEFGIFASIGVLFSFVISLMFIPSMLSLLKPRIKTNKVSKNEANAKLSIKITGLISNLKYLILVFSISMVLISIIGIFKISREVSILEYFKPKTNVRATEEMLKRNFGGSLPLYILIKGDVQDPRVLNQIKKVEDFLKTLEDVHNPQSIVDIIEEMNYAMGEGRKIPETKEKISNLIFLVEGEEIFNQLVSPDKDEAIIQAMVTYASSNKISSLVNKIQSYLNSISDGDLNVKFEQTGMPLIYKRLDDAIIKSQIQSLIFALIFVFLIMTFQLKSIPGGILGIIPISLTIIIAYGFMGYYGIPLDIATVLIAGISLGMGIDYSIHFMNRLKVELKKSHSFENAISNVLGTTGVAIFINALSVALGFAVLIFANVIPLQRLGILILLTMLLSAGATLILMPAIILVTKPKFLKKMISKAEIEKLKQTYKEG
ncbi:MAG: efflux RND transporter permease subunit [Candidatus Kryptonium sp.]